MDVINRMKWQHGETWYRVVGDLKGGLTPLVVLHGGPGACHNYCEPIADLIAPSGRAVVLYDQLGCGDSTLLPDKPKEFWTPELFMEELTLLLSHLGIEQNYILLGQSWGGMLAMQFAIENPVGLAGLIVADSPASMDLWLSEANRLREELPAGVNEVLLRHEAAGSTDNPEYTAAVNVFYDRHLCRVPAPACVLEGRRKQALDHTVYHTMNGPSEFHVVGSLKDWDITDELHRISVPTLLISGEHDEATPFIVKQIHDRIPVALWELFPESSHLPHIEEPARFKRVALAFLDSLN
ncbi:MAG: proline iminopeptidase-family hydrolase [Actinomycetes bacterium]